MKKILSFVLSMSLLASAFCENIVVKVASVAPARSPWEVEQKALAQEWSRITNGEVTLRFYNADALGGEGGVIKKMRSVRPGQKKPIDGGIFTSIGVYELAPASNCLTLSVPFMFRSQAELDYVLRQCSPQIEKSIENEGYKILGWFNVGWATFFTKKEARSPAELKKLKMASGGFDSPALGKSFKAAGFYTEDIPSEKVASSIKSPSGVESLYTVPMYAYASQYHKSLTYAIDYSVCPVMSAFVISNDTWNQIPAKYKADLMKAVENTQRKLVAAQQKADREYLNRIASEGGKLVKLSSAEIAAWEAAFKKDAESMTNVPGSVLNYSFYKQIQKMIETYRGK